MSLMPFTYSSILIALAWALYGALHSLLASRPFKSWIATAWPNSTAYYRLAYNLLAIILLAPLLLATEWASDDWLWRWEGYLAWIAHAITGLVLFGFAWSSRAYDTREFLGLDVRANKAKPQLGLSPLHRFVRHPWYALGLLWLWTRDMDSARLAATLTLSVYVWIGAHLEDIKLEQELGECYHRYRARVPGLIPWPGRVLSRSEYEQLKN